MDLPIPHVMSSDIDYIVNIDEDAINRTKKMTIFVIGARITSILSLVVK